MPLSLEKLRRAARQLRKDHDAGDSRAMARLVQHPPRRAATVLRHADYLHVIAQEQNFASWPALKQAVETLGLDRAGKLQHLKVALAHGNNRGVVALLADTADLAKGVFGLEVALYDRQAVEAALQADPGLAIRRLGPKTALAHLAFSRYHKARPDLHHDMMAIADLLLDHGADVNDTVVQDGASLSMLYGAIGHADNMPLGQWLLDKGANPNDGESLYHATELGHHDGLRMLLKAGADPEGTNALLRALDFNDHAAVRMLLNAGAQVGEFNDTWVGGERPWVIPALHQAARRMCDAEMIELLLCAGADPSAQYQGVSAYSYARVFGNTAMAQAIALRADPPALSEVEMLLASAAEEAAVPDGALAGVDLPQAYADLLRLIVHLPGNQQQIQNLVALGVAFDAPDAEGLTPTQIAGWEGVPDKLAYFLSLGPDLTHVNGYGGTLVSTILHGAQNCPQRSERDHVACLRLALEAGCALPENAASFVEDENLAAFIEDWRTSLHG